jgi:hypothetical protein
VWVIKSRIALILHKQDSRLRAELAASRMGTSCALIRKTWQARLGFVASGSASVATCAACLIAFLQAWTVAFLVCLLSEIPALVAESTADMLTIQHLATSSHTFDWIVLDVD